MGEVSFLLQRFLVVHVFHLPSYIHYIPAGIVERKKERIKDNFLLNMQFPFSGVFFQLLILSNWGSFCRYRKALYFWSLGISLYLELFCFLSFITFVLRNLCSGTHRRNPYTVGEVVVDGKIKKIS